MSVMNLEMGLVGLMGGLGDDGGGIIINRGWIFCGGQRQRQHEGRRKPVHCNGARGLDEKKERMVKESELFQASASEAASDCGGQGDPVSTACCRSPSLVSRLFVLH
jgi:hypothetical protein